MTAPRFIQIHSLCSYPGALLNRDDAGMAKRLPFGSTVRTRVSSQSLKRHWRFAGEATHDAAKRSPYSLQSLNLPMGDRTKELVEGALLKQALQGRAPLPEPARKALGDALLKELYGDKGIDAKARQALFFGQPEVDYLVGLTRELAALADAHPDLASSDSKRADRAAKAYADAVKDGLKDLRANLRALALGAGLESALFGRMVTSDPASNKDAPVHVAHAFTVHAMEHDLDFVTAVDDLRQRDENADAGSAGMFDTELTSGLFYGYVNVDVELLVSNLGGDRALAGRVLGQLLQLIARVSPGAKKGSTAPYAHAEWLMVEAGDDQPRTLANAFRNAVRASKDHDVFERSIQALQAHLQQLDEAYGAGTERTQLSVTPPPLDGVPRRDMRALVDWVETQVVGAPA